MTEDRPPDSPSTAPTAPAAEPPTDEAITNLIESYHATAEWIRFADAKAAVALTVNGALASVLIPQLTGRQWGSVMGAAALVLFALWALLAVGSMVGSFRCVLPFRKGGRHPALDHCAHFHPAAISDRYDAGAIERFVANHEQLGNVGIRREVLAGLLIDSHISANKYAMVTSSIQRLAWAAPFGFGFYLLTQFVAT